MSILNTAAENAARPAKYQRQKAIRDAEPTPAQPTQRERFEARKRGKQ